MGETDPYRGWDPVHLRREIGRLHEEMQSMAVLAEIDRNAYEALKAERDRLQRENAALRVANERLFRMMDRDAEACRNDDLQEVANIIQGYAQYLNPAYDAPPAGREGGE